MLLLAEYARLAEEGAEAELAAREDEVRLFLEVLWAAASADGRQRYMDLMRGAESPSPWTAVTVPDGHGGPPAMALILGQEDPGGEGVEAFRLEADSGHGAVVVAALNAWDRSGMEAVAKPSGWRLEALDDVERPDELDDADEGELGELAEADAGEGIGEASCDPAAAAPTWWPWAAVAGGLGVAGVLALVSRGSDE
ncbi:MAG: hypothetical protein R3A79_18810 [Nannocystaceae bacterium]